MCESLVSCIGKSSCVSYIPSIAFGSWDTDNRSILGESVHREKVYMYGNQFEQPMYQGNLLCSNDMIYYKRFLKSCYW